MRVLIHVSVMRRVIISGKETKEYICLFFTHYDATQNAYMRQHTESAAPCRGEYWDVSNEHTTSGDRKYHYYKGKLYMLSVVS